MDIPGVNYHLFDYAEGLRLSPKGFLLGTETTSTISSRGVYKFPVEETYETEYPDGQLSSYDLEPAIGVICPMTTGCGKTSVRP